MVEGFGSAGFFEWSHASSMLSPSIFHTASINISIISTWYPSICVIIHNIINNLGSTMINHCINSYQPSSIIISILINHHQSLLPIFCLFTFSKFKLSFVQAFKPLVPEGSAWGLREFGSGLMMDQWRSVCLFETLVVSTFTFLVVSLIFFGCFWSWRFD